MLSCCRQNAGPQAGYRDLLLRLQYQQGGPVKSVPSIPTDSPPRHRGRQLALGRRFYPLNRWEWEL